CRQLVRDLGRAGWTRYSVPTVHGPSSGNAASGDVRNLGAQRTTSPPPAFDVRSLALIRETLARHDALADFAFAMQGLGSGAISLAGSPELKDRYLPRVAAGGGNAAAALFPAGAGAGGGGGWGRGARD